MFKFLGRLFGTDKALEGVVDGVSKGLDALVYTSEEKAADARSERTEARRMVISWMAATQGQNLARRLIALSITGVWLMQFVVAQIMNLVQVWVSNPTQWAESATVMRQGAEAMSGAVMLILAFYFSAPFMGDVAKAVTNKFTKKVEDV